MSRWIVSALPIVIILAILQSRTRTTCTRSSRRPAGKVIFALAALWAVAGSFVIKRIVEIEV